MITEQTLIVCIVCIVAMALAGFVFGFLIGVLYVSDDPVGIKPIKKEHKKYRPEPVMPPQKIRPYVTPQRPIDPFGRMQGTPYYNYLMKRKDKP